MRRTHRRHALAPLLLCFGLLLVALVPTAAGDTGGLTSQEREWLNAHGPIRFAPDPAYPPFESVIEGNVSGINIDLLNRMSRNLDFPVEILIYQNWSVILEEMRVGNVDLLGSIARTDERETYMDFVGPYMQVGEVFYVRIESKELSTSADLAGLRVGVIQDYAAATWLAENRPDVTLVGFADMESGLDALSVGEVDAFFENIPVGGFYIRQNALTNIRILGEPAYYSDANWAVPKDADILASIIAKGMASIPLGEQTRVFEFWTGYDLGVQRAPAAGMSPLGRNLLVGVGVFALVVTAWGGLLRRTVKARTRDLSRLNDEVTRLNVELEERVVERTRDLELANRDLETFTYTVSHDLRTPLTTLRTYSTVLDKKYGTTLDADGQRYLERMVASTQRMNRLLDDVLKLSRAAARPLAMADVDLSRLANEVVDSLRTSHPERDVQITVRPGVHVRGDEDLLHIVMDNLIGNAWKYTRDRSPATIAFDWEEGPEGRTFIVSDNGAGFDPNDADRLFHPFARLHEDTTFEGTGVGLATVARIIERHGGTISGTARPDAGATFRFTLGGG